MNSRDEFYKIHEDIIAELIEAMNNTHDSEYPCRVNRNSYRFRYNQLDAVNGVKPSFKKFYNHIYGKSNLGKKRNKKYNSSRKGRIRQEKFNRSEKGIRSRRRYENSKKGIETREAYHKLLRMRTQQRRNTKEQLGREIIQIETEVKSGGSDTQLMNSLYGSQGDYNDFYSEHREIIEEFLQERLFSTATGVIIIKYSDRLEQEFPITYNILYGFYSRLKPSDGSKPEFSELMSFLKTRCSED